MQETVKYIQHQLESIYPTDEILAFTRIIVSHLLGDDYRKAMLDKPVLAPEQKEEVAAIVKRLQKHEPIQHIVGYTEFYNLPFKVNKNVLIPRYETEELVDLIIRENKAEQLQLLDIGTGSGAIAIALFLYMNSATVDAWEYSKEALLIAEENKIANNANIQLHQVDVLTPNYPKGKQYDIIVSNPPYIMECEKPTIESNVLDYEPHLALFVPDNDALIFYKRIADIAVDLLKDGGKLYFEINRSKADEVVEMLANKGFSNIELHRDMNKNERMIKAAYNY